MREEWIFNHCHPRSIYFDKKERLLTTFSFRLEKEKVSHIGCGHEPFLSIDGVATITTRRRGISNLVRARLSLCYGITFP